MTTIPLSTLPPPVRDRLRALAVEWINVNPWSVVLGWWSADGDDILPLHLPAGFDLAVRLVAERRRVPYQIVCIEVDSEPEKLAALVRGLT